MKKIILSFIILISCSSVSFASTVNISQIDTGDLFLKQDIKLYVNVSDKSGSPVKDLKKENVEIYESSLISHDTPVKIDSDKIQIEPKVNVNNGINFYLMIDNSGSMYQTMSGKSTSVEKLQRITIAKDAVKMFLNAIDNPDDKVGLASYNTNFDSFSEPVNNLEKIKVFLDNIEKPAAEERYTEIYGSLCMGVNDFKKIDGRRVIILLTDGANQPYYELTGKLHEVYGDKTFEYKEPIELCVEEGISIFPIYFGPKGGLKDKYLDEIANETGGKVFNAQSNEQLENVYKEIRNMILNEFLITYPATMFAANKKNVKLIFNDGVNNVETERYYFSGAVLGLPVKNISWLFLLPLLLALVLFVALVMLKFENKNEGAYLELLDKGVSKVSTKMFSLNNAKTVIGGSDNADMTIIGNNKNLKNSQATIVFDKKKDNFTIVSKGSTKVNNQPVKTKILEPGDVINVCGTTVVFDNNKDNKKK